MTMRRLASFLAVFVLVAGSVVLVPSTARAQGGAANWTIGDYWEYSGETQLLGTTYAVIVRLKVDHTADLTVGSQTYATYNCSVALSMSAGSTTIGVTGYINFRTSDLARVRVWYEIPIIGGWTELTYDPPLMDFAFPLSDNQTWSVTSTERSSSNSGTSTSTVIFDYSVDGPASITVPAGTFDAFAITEHELFGTPGILDYSDTVGFAVRLNGTVMGITAPGTLELKSYQYQAGSSTIIMVILLVLIIVIVVIVVIALLLARSRRKAQPVSPPSQYGQTTQQSLYRPPIPPSQP